MWAFYLPLSPYIIIKGLLNGHLFYYTNVNPGIDKYGGLFFDSKNTIDSKIPNLYRPITIIIYPENSFVKINEAILDKNLFYPLIAKPDKGERGKGIVKIDNEEVLKTFLNLIKEKYLIQEYIPFTIEYGVFVAYIPDEEKFRVISLTEKKFFTVKGNGKSNIGELIKLNKRGIVFFKQLKQRSVYPMEFIPEIGEECIIHTFGNHCNGTEFIYRNNMISEELNRNFNLLMQSIQGINYGRFDIKIEKSTDLIDFKNIKIIEFNGISAEPIHIYDSNVGAYLKTLKEFIKTWKYLDIIALNNRKLGLKPAPLKDILKKIGQRIINK